jgi:integrase
VVSGAVGLRRGEIAGLKWSDIDLAAGAIAIIRNRVQAGAGAVVENAPKTASSRRTLPLDQGLVTVLRRASARYAAERLALGGAHADSGYVAVNEAGEPYTPDTLTRMWRKLAETAACGRSGCTMRATPAGPRGTCAVCRWR